MFRRYDELASKELMQSTLPDGVTLEDFMAVCVCISLWIDTVSEGDQLLLSQEGCLERGSGLSLVYRDQEPFLADNGVIISDKIDEKLKWYEVVGEITTAFGCGPFHKLCEVDKQIIRLAYIALYQTPHIQFQRPS